MTVKELLIQLKIPSNEIKSRFISGQIKLNGQKLSNPDFKLSNDPYVSEFQDLGSFLVDNCSNTQLDLIRLLSPDPRLLFGTLDNEVVNIKSLQFLAEWNVLQISKKESWVFRNNGIIGL